jgi:branched-chain amino acid transport system permease protein
MPRSWTCTLAWIDGFLAALHPILVSGIVLASLYALMATGLALVWNTLGIFNFSHGVFMTLGAYVAWQVADAKGFGFGLSAGIAVAIAALAGLGILLNRLLISPFLGRKDIVLVAVMTTLAAAFFMENSALLIWGPRIKQLDRIVKGNVKLLGTAISMHELIIIILAPLVLIGLWAFLRWTRVGSAIRAVAQNRDSALLLGIRVNTIYSVAFAMSAALAGGAGVLLGAIRFITPTMGTEPLLKAFIVVILGGLGSLVGTIVSAYLIGFMEAASTYLIGAYWTQAAMFGVFILILVALPRGLMGRE